MGGATETGKSIKRVIALKLLILYAIFELIVERPNNR